MSKATDAILLKYFEEIFRDAFHTALALERPTVTLILHSSQSASWRGGDGDLLVDVTAVDYLFHYNFYSRFHFLCEGLYKLDIWTGPTTILRGCTVSYTEADSYDKLWYEVAAAVETYFSKLIRQI
jgi:hypothetical protein